MQRESGEMTISRGVGRGTGDMVTWGDKEVRGSGTVDTAENQWDCLIWSKNDLLGQDPREAQGEGQQVPIPNPKHGVGMNLKLAKAAPGFDSPQWRNGLTYIRT